MTLDALDLLPAPGSFPFVINDRVTVVARSPSTAWCSSATSSTGSSSAWSRSLPERRELPVHLVGLATGVPIVFLRGRLRSHGHPETNERPDDVAPQGFGRLRMASVDLDARKATRPGGGRPPGTRPAPCGSRSANSSGGGGRRSRGRCSRVRLPTASGSSRGHYVQGQVGRCAERSRHGVGTDTSRC